MVPLLMGVLASGCGSTSSSPAGSPQRPAAAPAGAAAASVRIMSFSFRPATVVVRPGARVTFTNFDSAPHTATAKDGSFDAGTIAHGQSRAVVLAHAGTYAYYCQFHAFMTATVIVR